MTVELSPYHELDIDPGIIDFTQELYCANCTHFSSTEEAESQIPKQMPYCNYWDDETRVESGMICAEYLPQGYPE